MPSGLGGAASGAATGSLLGPWGTAIGGLTGLLGGWLGHRGQQNQINDQNRLAEEQHRRALEEQRQAQLAQYNMGRGGFERDAAGQAVRGTVGGDLLSRYFENLDPAMLQRIGTATPYPNFEFAPGGSGPPTLQAAPGFTGFAGNVLSGIAPYIGMGRDGGFGSADPIQEYLSRIGQRGPSDSPNVGEISPNSSGPGYVANPPNTRQGY